MTFETIATLYVREARSLCKSVLASVGNLADAEDIVQDTFLALLEEGGEDGPVENLRGPVIH